MNEPGVNPVLGVFDSSNPDIVFVGDAPKRSDARYTVPFTGEPGELLRHILEEMGYDQFKLGFTNVCLCRPQGDEPPTNKEIKVCSEQLLEELRNLNPRFIVALGASAMHVLFGPNRKGITSMRGLIQETVLGIPGLATYHPSHVLNVETVFPEFRDDLGLVQELVAANQDKLQNVFKDNYTVTYVPSTIFDARDVLRGMSLLGAGTVIAYDWETTALRPTDGEGFCLGLSHSPNLAVVLPMWAIEGAHLELETLFNNKNLVIGAFNSSFDATWNEYYGLNPRMDFDPMLMHYCLDERPQSRSLERLSMRYFRAEPYESQMLAKYECTKADMTAKIPREVIYKYCGMDCDYTLRLYYKFLKDINKYASLMHLYTELITPGVKAFRKIESYGVLVDPVRLNTMAEEHEQTLADTLQALQTLLENPKYNPNSHVQNAVIIWDEMGLTEPDLYKRKPRSVDKATREVLLDEYPDNEYLKLLSTYHETSTMLTKYLRKLPNYVDGDGRVRCSYHFDRTKTGRLSTTNPPLHQIPRESTLRSLFIAPPGYKLVQADYAQIEMRIAASIAEDHTLAKLLEAEDFHTKMASEAFQIPYNTVSAIQRQAAKSVSFGLLYGMGEASLARKTGLPPRQAKEFVAKYKALTPRVQQWMAFIKKLLQETGVIESLFGRRRRFYVVTRQNRDNLYREAVNMPIQSAASDLTLWAATELELVDFAKRPYEHRPRVLMTIHDSIIVECKDEDAEWTARIMKKVMEDPPFATLGVGFPVDIKIGTAWGEGEEWVS